jgi:pyrroline-5-carboxylate reductase
MKITFIGGGNMGEAMVVAILDKKLSKAEDITVSEVVEARRQYLIQKYGIKATMDNQSAVKGSDVVVLAIKPQNLTGIMSELNGHTKPEQLVLSIIAGARIETLRKGLNHHAIVRSMPNTPAQIGDGVTVWTTTVEVTENQKKQAEMILGAMGKEFYATEERFLDAATAVSGSGPAYLFYFVESLIDAAVETGFTRETARELALGTVLGATHLLRQSGKEASDLRRAVTSPGGTTAAAMRILEEGGFHDLIVMAVKAAHNRAQELGGGQR